jgi:ubiquitin
MCAVPLCALHFSRLARFRWRRSDYTPRDGRLVPALEQLAASAAEA